MRNGRINRMTWAIVVAGLALGAAFCAREDKSALAMKRSTELIEGLRKHQIPGLPKVLTQAQADDVEKMRSGEGGWFVEKGCFGCHHVTVYGVKSFAAIGPDLSLAQEDVEKRFGKKLEEFWKAPVGTMMIVRTQLIKMTPEEEAEALVKLRKAYADHQAAKAAGTK
ncbi:MAG: hypothetical protein EPO35_13010 [Acidobacteria bacterium]|nr:MAG: hypothetical protein EPO35_13010 [Acidobacteriota bacterium]